MSRGMIAERSSAITLPLQGKEIDNPIKYLLDNGIVFKINQYILHPIGLSMSVLIDEDGNSEIRLVDYTKTPFVVFVPDQFKTGQSKWQKFWKSIGESTQNLRQRKLGFIKQSQADFREQQGR